MKSFIGYILLAVLVLVFILPLLGSFLKFLVVVGFIAAIYVFSKKRSKADEV